MEKNLICIQCPKGCILTAKIKSNNDEITDIEITGNDCDRGMVYGKQEILNPTRTITTTVKLNNTKRLPVKTSEPVDKNRIFEIMEAINKIEITGPIKIGDVICKNICGTNSNVVATKNG